MAPTNRIQDIFNVNGLVAVITGGGSGLGAFAARALDANGAKKVYIVGRREESLNATAKTGVNGTITPIVGDVTSKESLTQITEQVRREVGHVDLLFCNAGKMGPMSLEGVADAKGPDAVQTLQRALWAAEPDAFTNTFHVNVTAVYFTAIAFLDLLVAGNRAGGAGGVPQDGQILVTTSISGFSRNVMNSAAYGASKAATTHLVKMLSTMFALRQLRVRVNAIAPGLYPSEMTTKMVGKFEDFHAGGDHGNAFEGAKVMSQDRSPSERTGSEEDFAGTVLYMASRAGAYLNGEILVTDGGRLAQLPSAY